MSVETGRITTDIPARMDRLPWARWHWMIVVGLGAVPAEAGALRAEELPAASMACTV